MAEKWANNEFNSWVEGLVWATGFIPEVFAKDRLAEDPISGHFPLDPLVWCPSCPPDALASQLR